MIISKRAVHDSKKLTFVKEQEPSGLKELEIVTENYFCICHKNRRRRNQYFKLLFSKQVHASAHQTKYFSGEK